MVKVIVGTTTERYESTYSADTSLRTILEDKNVDYSTANVMLDGASLKAGDMDKTLEDMHITEKCMLVAVVKASNA